jgi:signal transduction histidine kinase
MFMAICGVIFFSVHADKEIYKAVTNEFLSDMVEISKGSVIAIKNDIDFTEKMLKIFNQTLRKYNYEFKDNNLKSDIMNIYNNIDFISINDLGFLDENGILKYNVTAPQLIGMDFSFRKYFKTIKSKNDPSFMYIQFIEFKGTDKGEKGLIITRGVFEEDEKSGELVFKGVAIITSRLKSFVEKYVKPLTIGKGGYMWFFDSRGEILYHPKASKQGFYQPGGKALSKSESFVKAIHNIVTQKSFIGNYEEDGELFAYAATPVRVGNDDWYFVVSVPEHETHAVLERYSTSYTVTTILVFAVVILGLFFLFILYLRSLQLHQTIDVRTYQLKYTKKINEELDSIINTIAHDLKTPLTSVMGFSQQLLTKSLEQKKDEKDTKSLSKIYSNANYMKELIDSLLEFSRVGSKKNVIEDVSLKELIKEVELQMYYTIEKTNAIINTPKEMSTIRADKMKINQLFTNLISNAIKFVPKDRDPVIDIGFNETDEFYNISISDNGIGIDESEMEEIFKIFHRVKDVEASGTGVGLAIVKKIIDEQDAKITIKPNEPVGTTFTVSFKK